MASRRKLSQEEIDKIAANLSLRDRCIFSIGLKTGFRISEILSLNFEDVFDGNQVKTSIHVSRSNMKGKKSSRTVPLHNECRSLLADYLARSQDHAQYKDRALFYTRQNSRLSRVQFHRNLKEAASKIAPGFDVSRIASHSMRKSFAWKIYEATKHDLLKTQIAMGHKNPSSTVSYLEVNKDEIDALILA